MSWADGKADPLPFQVENQYLILILISCVISRGHWMKFSSDIPMIFAPLWRAA